MWVIANDITIKTRSDDEGNWSADFTGQTVLQSDTQVEVKVFDDDGDLTDWNTGTLSPYVQAGPNQGFVYGRNWPTGIQVHLTVTRSGSIMYQSDAIVGPCGDGNPGSGPCGLNDVYFDLGYSNTGVPRFDLLPGDVITLTSEDITKSMIVSALQITYINISTDTISGIADIGRDVGIGICNGPSLVVTPDASGHWTANFAPFDITPGLYGGSTQSDDIDNYTQQGLGAPIPTIYASITGQWINAGERDWLPTLSNWSQGTVLTLTIDDPSNGAGIDYTTVAVVEPNPYNPSDLDDIRARFDLPPMGLQSGFIATVTGNGVSKTLIMSFRVETIDAQADTIAGIASPGVPIEVCVIIAGNCVHRHVTADPSGNWLANYHEPGIQPDEQGVVDIQGGTYGWAYEQDEDLDQIWADWIVPFNQPPQITSINAPLIPVPLGQSIDATVVFSDPDVGDSHTVTWEWGDNSSTTAPATVPTVTTSHTYPNAGVYAITATITDNAGASNSVTFQYVVIYDPLAGFVTGGGWIMSPAGAYTTDPTLEGMATFGFVSMYKKGADVPDGNTEFQFIAGDLHFHSTSYEWLIVNQDYANAQFKGYGTINGVGNYSFMIWAGDGSPDTFRIKIWDPVTGAVVYDNGVQQPIGSGSIVIHK